MFVMNPNFHYSTLHIFSPSMFFRSGFSQGSFSSPLSLAYQVSNIYTSRRPMHACSASDPVKGTQYSSLKLGPFCDSQLHRDISNFSPKTLRSLLQQKGKIIVCKISVAKSFILAKQSSIVDLLCLHRVHNKFQ